MGSRDTRCSTLKFYEIDPLKFGDLIMNFLLINLQLSLVMCFLFSSTEYAADTQVNTIRTKQLLRTTEMRTQRAIAGNTRMYRVRKKPPAVRHPKRNVCRADDNWLLKTVRDCRSYRWYIILRPINSPAANTLLTQDYPEVL